MNRHSQTYLELNRKPRDPFPLSLMCGLIVVSVALYLGLVFFLSM